jgi:hypothetical protein
VGGFGPTEPPQVYELRAGRRIGADLVQRVAARVQQLRLLDDHVGGIDTYGLVTAGLDAAVTLLREAAYTEPIGRRLLGVVGELCQVAGWVASDAGRTAEATGFHLAGVRAAHAAGDEQGAASNPSSLAYQTSNIGDVREAVALAGSAVRGAQQTASALPTTPTASTPPAQQWFRRAAEAGIASAMFNLGHPHFDSGRVEEAEQWFRRAAEAGHTPPWSTSGSCSLMRAGSTRPSSGSAAPTGSEASTAAPPRSGPSPRKCRRRRAGDAVWIIQVWGAVEYRAVEGDQLGSGVDPEIPT